MLNSVSFDARAGQGYPVTLMCDLEAASPNDTIVLESISGLSSTDVTLFTGDFVRDGGYYQGRRVPRRNVVFNFLLREDYANNIDVSKSRELLYKTFMQPANDRLLVRCIMSDFTSRSFYCYTEKLEGDMFVKNNKFQASTIMLDPYLSAPTLTGWANPVGVQSTGIYYAGTAPTGFVAEFKVVTATPSFVIDLENFGSTLIKKPAGNFAVNDVIRIDTRPGIQSLKVNGLDALTFRAPGQRWPMILPNWDDSDVISVLDGVTYQPSTAVRVTKYEFYQQYWGI